MNPRWAVFRKELSLQARWLKIWAMVMMVTVGLQGLFGALAATFFKAEQPIGPYESAILFFERGFGVGTSYPSFALFALPFILAGFAAFGGEWRDGTIGLLRTTPLADFWHATMKILVAALYIGLVLAALMVVQTASLRLLIRIDLLESLLWDLPDWFQSWVIFTFWFVVGGCASVYEPVVRRAYFVATVIIQWFTIVALSFIAFRFTVVVGTLEARQEQAKTVLIVHLIGLLILGPLAVWRFSRREAIA